jgi:hypothetical protein
MTSTLRLTLLADGRSDACLLVLLRWLVGDALRDAQIESAFADLGVVRERPRTLHDRIRKAVELYPCDILFVHRDAESSPPEERITEIRRAVDAAATGGRWVPVVPVRMTEAWLLVDELAIRVAAANPSGTVPLELPPLSRLETLPSPKQALHEALQVASGRTGRRLEQFRRDLGRHVQRVAQVMQQREKLRDLTAFKRLEKDTREALRGLAEGGSANRLAHSTRAMATVRDPPTR